MIVLSRVRGFERPAIIAASLFGAVGIAATIAAASIDGFWIPWFAWHMLPESNQAAIGEQLLAAASIFIQVASKFGLVGMAMAIVMYSFDFIVERSAIALGVYGMLTGVAILIMLSTIATRLTPHTLLFPMALQTIWFVATGTAMAKGRLTTRTA